METTHQWPQSCALYDSDIEIKYSMNQELPKKTAIKQKIQLFSFKQIRILNIKAGHKNKMIEASWNFKLARGGRFPKENAAE